MSFRDRYSLFVGTMKMLLPAMAAALVILIVAWPQIVGESDKFRLGAVKLGPDQLDNLSMLNARFDGVDEQNQPYTITTDVATQSREQENLIEMELPKADLTLNDGTWLALTAKTGEYDSDSRLLRLQGNVSVFHDEGFEMRTQTALIDLADSIATGGQPVEGYGTSGSIQAEGFRILERGRIIIFTGRSHLTLIPQDLEGRN